MPDGLHIALATPGFPADEDDTACIPALADYVRGLRQAHPHWRISIFALHYPATRVPYVWHGATVFPVGGGNRRFPFSPLARSRLLTALFRAGPFDVVHAFWLGECAAVARLFTRLTRCPLVITLMGQEVRRADTYRRLIGRPGVTTVAVSPFQRHVLLQTGGPDVGHVIPWGVEAASVTAPLRDIHVLGVGNLIPVKDPLTFVRVIAELSRQWPGLRACWAGGGPMLEEVRALAVELGIADRLSLPGAISRAQVFDLMARSRVLLHTAVFESFAMVMAEARAHGANVVSTAVGIAPAAPGPGFYLSEGVCGLTMAVNAALMTPPVPPTRPWGLEHTISLYTDLYRGLV